MRKLGIHFQEDQPRLRYTLDFLRKHPLFRAVGLRTACNNTFSENDWNIVYQAEAPPTADFFMPAQSIFFSARAMPQKINLTAFSHNGQKVYGVFPGSEWGTGPMIRGNILQFDLFESIFFHISRFEEVFAPKSERNSPGWLEEDRHLLVRHQVQRLPVVDQLVAALIHLLTGREVVQATAYALSHDIDFLYRYPTPVALLRALAGTISRGEGLSRLRQHWQTYRQIRNGEKKDPYDCFHWLFSDSDQWTAKNLYLMAGGETPYDNHYRIEDPKIREIIGSAEDRGYSIGLHPSYNAAFSEAQFTREQQQLELITGKPVSSSRQHWLRWDWQLTPDIIRKAGIREDASIGYRRHVGFRAGTGFPFYLYDFQTEAPFPWLERPLALMESAALHEARSTEQDPTQLMQAFLNSNRENTQVAINFHNSNFDPTSPTGTALAAFYKASILNLPG